MRAVIPATELADCDAVLERLTVAKQAWIDVSIPERIQLLKDCMEATAAAAEGIDLPIERHVDGAPPHSVAVQLSLVVWKLTPSNTAFQSVGFASMAGEPQ